MSLSDLLLAAGMTMFCIAFAQLFMRAYKVEAFGRAFWLKGGAALCFVALGAMLLGKSGNPAFARLVLIGLVLGLLGDELLALRFLVPKLHDAFFGIGAISFAVGHGFYMKALFGTQFVRWPSLILIFLVGLAVANLYGKKQGSDAGIFQIPTIIYMSLVVFMGAVACSAFLHSMNLGLLLFAVGGVCFGGSDNILFAHCFGKNPTWSMNVWVHITYYAAQLLIAWSILFI